MITIKNNSELKKMRESNAIVAGLLSEIGKYVKEGVSTFELDTVAEDYIRSRGAIPAFKGYMAYGLSPFPGSICASINHCIVHGIPSREKILKSGDIISIDVGVLKDGFYGDAACTYTVGSVSEEIDHLLEITKEALDRGIEVARDGARVGDISYAIGSFVRENGLYVADQLTGHGIGRSLHEDPQVPNIGQKDRGPRLRSGMTLALEPMVNIGTNRVEEKGWEFLVADGTYSAHFEKTIAITDGAAEILSNY